MPPEDPIRPGDWVVWSGWRDAHHEHIASTLGPGPFKVSDVSPSKNLRFYDTEPDGWWYGPRFRKDTFITAVKEALKDA